MIEARCRWVAGRDMDKVIRIDEHVGYGQRVYFETEFLIRKREFFICLSIDVESAQLSCTNCSFDPKTLRIFMANEIWASRLRITGHAFGMYRARNFEVTPHCAFARVLGGWVLISTADTHAHTETNTNEASERIPTVPTKAVLSLFLVRPINQPPPRPLITLPSSLPLASIYESFCSCSLLRPPPPLSRSLIY